MNAELRERLPGREAITIAREIRRGERGAELAEVYRAAERDAGGRFGAPVAQIYRHAMLEAGFLENEASGRPFNPCPVCGVSFCRTCEAAIVWARTASGKRVPLDAEPREDGNVYVDDNGVAVYLTRDELERFPPPAESRFVSHFATCPHAEEHRRATPGRRGS